MFKVDWDVIRAYALLSILTVVALYAVWKDKKDYKRRAHEEKTGSLRGLFKRNAVTILYAVTIAAAVLSALDIHSTRNQAAKDNAEAQADKLASKKQIEDLRAVVKAGNDLLGQQRQDFLKQFSNMAD